MSLAGVPEGYISLPEARGQVSEAIAEAAGHNVAALKKILDPDEVEKGPPRAISNAAFKALYKPVGQGKLDVFTMHPSSGAIVRVPVLVFLNAKAPRELFSSPSPHFDPGLPEGYEQFKGRTLFVRNDNQTKEIVAEAIKSVLSGKSLSPPPEKGAPETEGQAWAKSAPTLEYWPLEFALMYLGHGSNMDAALTEYSEWVDYAPKHHLSEMAFSKYVEVLNAIERLARSGTLEVFGVRVLRNGQRERTTKITSLDWMDLKLQHDFSGERGLYAAVSRPVPFAEWWQNMYVERRPFLKISNPNYAKAATRGRPPARQELAIQAAKALWGKADWPSNMTQLNALAKINGWLKTEQERIQREEDPEAKLHTVSLNTVKAAFRRSKAISDS